MGKFDAKKSYYTSQLNPSSFVLVNSLPESSQWSCVKQFTIRIHPVWGLKHQSLLTKSCA